MLEPTGRVQRVAIDDHMARAQRAKGGDRILQHVRHHQRDTGVPRQSRNILQVARDAARFQVQFAIGHRLSHADEGGPITEFFEAGLNEIAERTLRAQVNLGRHAVRIGLEPYPFHQIPVNRACPIGAAREYRTGHAFVDEATRPAWAWPGPGSVASVRRTPQAARSQA